MVGSFCNILAGNSNSYLSLILQMLKIQIGKNSTFQSQIELEMRMTWRQDRLKRDLHRIFFTKRSKKLKIGFHQKVSNFTKACLEMCIVKNCNIMYLQHVFIFMKKKKYECVFYKQGTTFSRSGNSIENYNITLYHFAKRLSLYFFYVHKKALDVR